MVLFIFILLKNINSNLQILFFEKIVTIIRFYIHYEVYWEIPEIKYTHAKCLIFTTFVMSLII